MRRTSTGIALLAMTRGISACTTDASPELDLLDPSSLQYGKSYPEWAAEWVAYLHRVAPPECADPLQDADGASCQLYQDPESPVFFLVGAAEGRVVRGQCAVPRGKGLFFPLVQVWRDNAGASGDTVLGDEQLASDAATRFAEFVPEALRLSVDGQRIGGLSRGALVAAPYNLTLAPEANRHTCAGSADVAGDFAGYLSGYWAMLPSLTAGQHTVEFSAASQASGSPRTELAVRYELNTE